MHPSDFLFPHPHVRNIQLDMLKAVDKAVSSRSHIIVHAPTGIGKTAAALGPALRQCLKNKLLLFFLTSRHTQHRIVIDTLRSIKQIHKVEFAVTDIIGKKWMCAQQGVDKMYTADFFEYCRQIRKEGACQFYENLRLGGLLSPVAEKLISDLREGGGLHSEELVKRALSEKMCPYEIALLLAKSSNVIVADYSYVFSPIIRNGFLSKLGRGLDSSILIIDEGHNLPKRLVELLSDSLSVTTLRNAQRELSAAGLKELQNALQQLNSGLAGMTSKQGEERLVPKREFTEMVESVASYSELTESLSDFAAKVRETKQRSWCGSVARFLENWQGQDEGFVRFVKNTANGPVLYYRGLDPSLLSRDIIKASHSTILMSGTLTPTEMFKHLLGFPENTKTLELESPFPKENRLALIVPATSTKFSNRSEQEYKRIAAVCSELCDVIPGNIAVFFPSYALRDAIGKDMDCTKPLLYEARGMTKEAKQSLLEKFIALREKGAVLMAVVRGSFGEGIDLPGDYLRGVIVVGLPLSVPDIETKALIEYFDRSFGRGLDYAYIYPAINLALQSAGRCIRSEHDKGIVVFLDERYAYSRYRACFPKDWGFIITRDFEPFIQEFISGGGKD